MTWKTYYANIVCECLTAKLSAEANLASLFEKLLLKLDVTECATSLVTCCWEAVIVLCRSKLNGEEVLLGRSTTDNECDVIRRTSSCAESLHLLNEERNESARVLDTCLSLLIEV